MPVTAVNLRSMEARRYQDPAPNQQVRIDHNSTLTLVHKESDDRLRIEFGYTTSYGPLGMVKMEGTLQMTDARAGQLATEWSTTRNLPPDAAQMVHSAILMTCVPEAVGLAKNIRLPPPVPIPQVQFQGKPGAPGGPAAPAPADRFSPEVG